MIFKLFDSYFFFTFVPSNLFILKIIYMKDFPKIVLGSALGFIVASICISVIFFLFFFITAGSLVKSVGEEQFVPANNSVLNLSLSGNIRERIPRTTTFIPKDESSTMGLDDIIAAIRKAKNDHRIKGIYLNPRIFAASPATLAQIRQELIDFKESGKFIVAYADTYTQSGYYLASIADKIAVNPQGSLDMEQIESDFFVLSDDDSYDIGDITQEEILYMIQQLPKSYRTVFNLFVFEDMSHKEIGKMLGIKESTSRSQYSRARAILREKINAILKNKR
jgi:RNA polymerase sigma factor (sigma-70 family)